MQDDFVEANILFTFETTQLGQSTGTGTRFSKVPVTLRARNQKFKSK